MDRSTIVLHDQKTHAAAPRRLLPIAILAALTLVAAVPGFLLRAHTAPQPAYAAPASEAEAERRESVAVASRAASGEPGAGRRVVLGVAVSGTRMHVTVDGGAWHAMLARDPGTERHLLEDEFAASYRRNHPQGYVGDELTVVYTDEKEHVLDAEPLQP